MLFFLDLSTRHVEIAGMASTANGLWMGQIGRRVTDAVDGILNGKRYLVHDRDPLFTAEFLNLLAGVGIESAKLPLRSPNLNAHAERFVRSIKESCLDRLILFGEESLRSAAYGMSAPGPRESTPPSRAGSCGKHRRSPAARASRWNAELLLPSGRLSGRAFAFPGHTRSRNASDKKVSKCPACP
jgi:hypothetical protein